MNSRPVLILGCQRSGTTVLMRLLSYHPSFAWISQYLNLLRRFPQIAVLSRLCDAPVIGSYLKRQATRWRMIPRAVEPGHYFSRIEPGFHKLHASSSLKGALLNIPSESTVQQYREEIRKIQKYQGKERYIAKHTTKPDMHYFNHVFPNAFFIHLVRDGRAVVNSLNNMYINRGWFPKSVRDSIMELFPMEFVEFIGNSSFRHLAFFSCYYCFVVHLLNDQMTDFSDGRTLVVKYENLTENPFEEFQRILQSANLPFCQDFWSFLQFHNLENRNYKFRRDLPHAKIRFIERAIARFLNNQL